MMVMISEQESAGLVSSRPTSRLRFPHLAEQKISPPDDQKEYFISHRQA